jgi:hypothetical protein
MFDGAGLDCLPCGLFFNNAVLQQWENELIATIEKESFQQWQSEQLQAVA